MTVPVILLLLGLPVAQSQPHAEKSIGSEPDMVARVDRVSARPNILFLFTDDQRPDGVAALGNPVVRTPNLDRLARQGLVFTNTYCFGANSPAVCLPSRNMLLSGRCYFRWQGPYASGDDPNLPASFRRAGYVTYHHGKKGNTARQIHERFEISKYVDDRAARTSGEPGSVIVDEAIEFLRRRTDDRPFLMYLAFASPHDPRIAAERYRRLYRPEYIRLPANYLPLHPFNNGEMTIRDEKLAPWPRTEDEIRRQLHDYYAVISGLDAHIGRLLAALREMRLDGNTIIVFSSDNGLALGSHGLMGKQNLYEHSARVPLVMSGPGIPVGRSDALVYLMDLFPTLCELAGAAIPEGLDGRSLAPVITGDREAVRDTLFMAYRDVQRAVRDDRWKLIRYPRIAKTQLFDLQTDPHERHDLSDLPAHADRVTRLTRALKRCQQTYGDTLPWRAADQDDPNFTPPAAEDGHTK